jgi:hypothetical protein
LLTGPAAPHLQQPVDNGVQIHFLVGHYGRSVTKDKEEKETKKRKRNEKDAPGEGMTSEAGV